MRGVIYLTAQNQTLSKGGQVGASISMEIDGTHVDIDEEALCDGLNDLITSCRVDASLTDYAESVAVFLSALKRRGCLISLVDVVFHGPETRNNAACIENRTLVHPEEILKRA